MKVLLLHPPNNDVYSKFDRGILKRLPIGLAYIAAAIRDAGFELEILDAEALNMGIKECVALIQKKDIDILGITATTPLITIAHQIAKEVKAHNLAIETILGGPHASSMPSETLKVFVSFDYIVLGEGELTIAELLKTIDRGKIPYNIAGVGFRDNGKIIINKKRDFIKDLDSVSLPLRDIFPNEKYLDPTNYSGTYTLAVTSRGCPYNCIFCGSASVWGKSIRFRSAENILDELEIIVEKLKIKNITFSDDTFTLKKERVLKLCKGIIERKLGINFHCSSRADTIDEDRILALKKAGCQGIGFGFESGDNDILKVIKKGITVDDIRRAAELTKKHGLQAYASYMLGNPGETNETIKKTIELALELKTDRTQFCIATPFPGTELWAMAKQQNKIKHKDFSEYYWYYSVAANMTDLSDEQLLYWQRYAYQRLKEEGRHG